MTYKTPTKEDMIACAECGAKVHAIKIHLRDGIHGGMTVEEYQAKFPNAPLMSAYAEHLVETRKSEGEKAAVAAATKSGHSGKRALHEVFDLGAVKGAMNARGNAIMINVFNRAEFSDLVPDVDDGYVYDIPCLKDALLALELNIPLYVWGHTGTGKTTLLEQICARTGRPVVRVQHTVNTEESHIVGQLLARDGGTYFEPGPLYVAMRDGLTYIADEYDFAMPSVLSVYQAVLEGKPLVIKEAPADMRVVKPHPEFRFTATGNTNGAGDETGLYLGTSMQNSANYDRFGMVIKKDYMPNAEEVKILRNQGGLEEEDAKRMVSFATKVREAHSAGKCSVPISPRTLIFASVIGVCRSDLRTGIERSFLSKLNSVDRKVCEDLAQRILG